MRSEPTPRAISNAAATVAALGLVSSAGGAARAAERRRFLFLHVAMKQRALQSGLDQALPGAVVAAVGRAADFERALSQGQDARLGVHEWR